MLVSKHNFLFHSHLVQFHHKFQSKAYSELDLEVDFEVNRFFKIIDNHTPDFLYHSLLSSYLLFFINRLPKMCLSFLRTRLYKEYILITISEFLNFS